MTALQEARKAFKALPLQAQDAAEEYFKLVQLALIPKVKVAGLRASNKFNTKVTQIRNSNVGDEKALNLITKIKLCAEEAGDVFEDEVTKIKKSIEGGK